MFTYEQRLDNLMRHVTMVRDNCLFLGKKLIQEGRKEFGRILIGNGLIHDASKFSGIEWEYLHTGPDVPKDKLELAIVQHNHTNSHHPEFWGGINNMPEISIAEMTVDWLSRSQEFGTDVREWVATVGMEKFGFEKDSWVDQMINYYLDMLVANTWVADVPPNLNVEITNASTP